MRRMLPVPALLALCSLAKAEIPELADPPRPAPAALAATPAEPAPSPGFEPAPRDASRLPFPGDARALMHDLDTYFQQEPTTRLHVRLDRPLYRPGDSVSVRVWDVLTRGMTVYQPGVTLQLLDPRGTMVQNTWTAATAALPLPADAAGGEWKLRATGPDGKSVERTFVVANFQAPRVKKTLEFARDGYGPGEEVEAAVTLERATGEKLADVVARVQVQADGVALPPLEVRTDRRGEALVRFALPAELRAPDVLLTVLVDDAGVTESISRSVPVVLDRVQLAFFPEGGDLVAGLASRVYFEATDPSGEPADVTGTIQDDRGAVVAELATAADGRGAATFTPQPGRKYRAHVARAHGDDAVFPLPDAERRGCVIHHYDDLEGVQQAVRVGVTCAEDRDVVLLASQQEQIIDRAAIHATAKRPVTVYLRSAEPALSGAQGVARVTLMNGDMEPLAERLVYRNKSRRLSVEVEPDRDRYSPGDEVSLTVRTRDPEGRAVPAELSVAVVDDALLSFADDDGHSLMSQVLLQADLPEPIDGAAEWFDPSNPDGGRAIDLALGTRGWRRFDWDQVRGRYAQLLAEERAQREWEAQALLEEAQWAGRSYDGYGGALSGLGYVGGGPAPAQAPAMPSPPPMAAPRGDVVSASGAKRAEVRPSRQFAAQVDKSEDAADAPANDVATRSAPIEARTDFRDTVFWEPALRTDAEGRAKVRFTLSDAVTGFRASAEGAGAGWLGQGEATLASSLPFSLDVRVPVALSDGDQLLLPVTLENQRDVDVAVDLDLAATLLRAGALPGDLSLRAGERRTVHVPLTATRDVGVADLTLRARAGDLGDGVTQHVPVAPRGFPLHWAASGVLEGEWTRQIAIDAAIDGSVTGRITVFPTSVSELTEGIESMVREPGGCFEQTSSTNYPNVVILDLLDRSGQGGKLAVDRQHVLKSGYDRLVGYQVESGGFETFGSGPGKEALTAFGLLEFSDMGKVFPVDRRVTDENVKYLFGQRTGKGGYAITGASAHGYGTAPPEVLDAYITYALVETGHVDLPEEIAQQSAVGKSSKDPYTLALATMTLLRTRPAEGKAAEARLAALQAADGSFPGSETSITRSENQNLLVEATALSTMAALRAGDRATASKAVRWFQANQRSAGAWGATQGNALALKAIGEFVADQAQLAGGGRVVVKVDGVPAGEATFAAGQHDPVEIALTGLTGGKHTVSLALDHGSVPFAVDVGWSSDRPDSDDGRRVDLVTRLADADVGLGETTRLTATLTNRTREVVPDPIARIGLPAGLEAQTWQLQQLVDRGEIAFFETRPREVTLYWHGIAADEVHTVALDLTARVPGTFTGPASSAYPYYDDQARAWSAGLPVVIRP